MVSVLLRHHSTLISQNTDRSVNLASESGPKSVAKSQAKVSKWYTLVGRRGHDTDERLISQKRTKEVAETEDASVWLRCFDS